MDEHSKSYAEKDERLTEQLAKEDYVDYPQASLFDEIRDLIGDGRALAEAEFAWQKARVKFAGKQAGRIALLGLLAIALAFCALMALVFGTVLALVPILSAWGAMAAVTGGLLIAAGLAALVAVLRVRRMTRLIANRKAEP
ncbi:MAG: phage holin family protein [Novosphingobium sp.]